MGEIVLKNIDMTLDPSSIEKAVEELRSLTIDLQYALDSLCEYLLKEGVKIARLYLRSYFTKGAGANKGNLIRSIRYEMADGKSGEGYLLAGYPGDHMSENPKYANVSYAVFFEFGFGTANYYTKDGKRIKKKYELEVRRAHGTIGYSEGRTSDHPSGKGQYRKPNEFGDPITNKHGGSFRGWVYKDRWTGKFYTVRGGQPPKPFMYNTLMELTERAERDGGRIIAEYIPQGGKL